MEHLSNEQLQQLYDKDISIETAQKLVQNTVKGNDELLKNPDKYGDHPFAGHCYVASESLFHLTGGYDVWYVERISMDDVTHWYLRNKQTNKICDITSSQFDKEIPYSESTKSGFLTSEPSKRTQTVLNEIVSQL